MAGPNQPHDHAQHDREQRLREVEREASNTRAENNARMAQCDPSEIARQAQENLAKADLQGRGVPQAEVGPKSARPRPEVPGG
jgi:hypothetical protein